MEPDRETYEMIRAKAGEIERIMRDRCPENEARREAQRALASLLIYAGKSLEEVPVSPRVDVPGM